jgi:hypothetical protein
MAAQMAASSASGSDGSTYWNCAGFFSGSGPSMVEP